MYTENLIPGESEKRIARFNRSKINRLIEGMWRKNAICKIVENTPEIKVRGFGQISFDSSNQRLKNGGKIIEGANPESTNILGVIVNQFQRKILKMEDLVKFFKNGKASDCIILTKTENSSQCSVEIHKRRAIKFLKKKGTFIPHFLRN